MSRRASVHLRWRTCLAEGEGAESGVVQPWSTEVFSTLGAALDVVRAETLPTIWRTSGPGAAGRVWTQIGGKPREVRRIAEPPVPRARWVDPMEGIDWVHEWEYGAEFRWMMYATANVESLRWRTGYALAIALSEALDDGREELADVRAAVQAMRRSLRRPETFYDELDPLIAALPSGPRDKIRQPIMYANRTRSVSGLSSLHSLFVTAAYTDRNARRWADVLRGAITVDAVFLAHTARLRAA